SEGVAAARPSPRPSPASGRGSQKSALLRPPLPLAREGWGEMWRRRENDAGKEPLMLTAYTPERFAPTHFGWSVEGPVATITLNRPERKNPLTFESYAELRDLFRDLAYANAIRAVVVTGAGGNFCSGGDVHEIIGPLVKMEMGDLLRFTRMTGD